MENSTEMKLEMVKSYISTLDLKNFNTNNLTIKQIKEGIKNILGHEPAISMKYENDTMLVESGGEMIEKKIENVISISIAFIDGSYTNNEGKTLPRPNKFEFMIN